jgi:hypothetical protein
MISALQDKAVTPAIDTACRDTRYCAILFSVTTSVIISRLLSFSGICSIADGVHAAVNSSGAEE